MTQENKDLLIKDLCGRLPYGVKIALKNSEAYHHENVAKKGDITIDRLKGFNGSYFSIYHDNPQDWDWYVSDIDVEDVKPCLFPISSMTKEQKREYAHVVVMSGNLATLQLFDMTTQDWFNKNHIDYRGLIPMGLALDATGLNIY